jgi:hypothetical protein
MRKLFTLLCFLLSAIISDAQDDKMDKIEAYKIAFITERLDLTSKEATVFWPVYNEYMDKLRALKKQDRERTKAFNLISDPSEAESDKFLKEFLAFKKQEKELTCSYVAEFRKVIPTAKVAKLVTLEQEFKMQLLQKYKEKKK